MISEKTPMKDFFESQPSSPISSSPNHEHHNFHRSIFSFFKLSPILTEEHIKQIRDPMTPLILNSSSLCAEQRRKLEEYGHVQYADFENDTVKNEEKKKDILNNTNTSKMHVDCAKSSSKLSPRNSSPVPQEFMHASSTSSAVPFDLLAELRRSCFVIPVLKRPWAIQRIMLFVVGKESDNSLIKAARLAHVCSDWHDTMFELGTSDFILPQNFIHESKFMKTVRNNMTTTTNTNNNNTSAPTSNSIVSSSIAVAKKNHFAIDQQEIVAHDSFDIMERVFETKQSIKLTRALRRCFDLAGFDFSLLQRNLSSNISLRFKVYPSASQEVDEAKVTSSLTKSKKPVVIATMSKARRNLEVHVVASGRTLRFHKVLNLFDTPFSNERFLLMHLSPSSQCIGTPKEILDSLDANYQIQRRVPQNPAVLRLSPPPTDFGNMFPVISPDGRFIAMHHLIDTKRFISVVDLRIGKTCLDNHASITDHFNREYSSISPPFDFYEDIYSRPCDLAFSQDGSTLFVCNRSGEIVHFVKKKVKSQEVVDHDHPQEEFYIFERREIGRSTVKIDRVGHSPMVRWKGRASYRIYATSDNPPVVNEVKMIQPCHVPESINLYNIASLGLDGVIGVWNAKIDQDEDNHHNENRFNDDDDNEFTAEKYPQGDCTLRPYLSLKPQSFIDNSATTLNSPPIALHCAFFTYTQKLVSIHSDLIVRVWDLTNPSELTATPSCSKIVGRCSTSGIPIISEIDGRGQFSSDSFVNVALGHQTSWNQASIHHNWDRNAIDAAAFSHYDDRFYAVALKNSTTTLVVNISGMDVGAVKSSGKIIRVPTGRVSAVAFPAHTSSLLVYSSHGSTQKVEVRNINTQNIVHSVQISSISHIESFAVMTNSYGSGFLSCVDAFARQELVQFNFEHNDTKYANKSSRNSREVTVKQPIIDVKVLFDEEKGQNSQVEVEDAGGNEYLVDVPFS